MKVLLILTIILISAQALSHDDADPHALWYRNLRTLTGASCCGLSATNDCNPIEARVSNIGWQIFIDDEWVDVPPEAILNKYNPIGEPIACINSGRILCFVPASQM